MSAAACAKIILCGARAVAEVESVVTTIEAYPKEFKEADFKHVIDQLWEIEATGKKLNEFVAGKLGGGGYGGGGYSKQ